MSVHEDPETGEIWLDWPEPKVEARLVCIKPEELAALRKDRERLKFLIDSGAYVVEWKEPGEWEVFAIDRETFCEYSLAVGPTSEQAIDGAEIEWRRQNPSR